MATEDRAPRRAPASRAALSTVGWIAGIATNAASRVIGESRKHRAAKLLRQIPCIGPIRAARLLALMQTPYRFRSKRQLWTYRSLLARLPGCSESLASFSHRIHDLTAETLPIGIRSQPYSIESFFQDLPRRTRNSGHHRPPDGKGRDAVMFCWRKCTYRRDMSAWHASGAGKNYGHRRPDDRRNPNLTR